MDNSWSITPDKFWEVNDGIVVEDVRKAFNIFQIASAQLMDIINYAFKLAEGGEQYPVDQRPDRQTRRRLSAPQKIHNDNANALLRHQGYSVDDHVTEPVVHQSYEYLLMDPDGTRTGKRRLRHQRQRAHHPVEKAIQEKFPMRPGQRGAQPGIRAEP